MSGHEVDHPLARLLDHFLSRLERIMSQNADAITNAAADITAAVATLTANGLPDPALAPAVASLETAVAALAALVPPTP